MPMVLKKDDGLNECFWAFVYLVVLDESHLSIEGKMMKEIVQAGGYCESISMIARKLKLQKPKASSICKKMQCKGYITLVKVGNKKVVKFNETIITKALKIPYKIVGEQ